MVTAIHGVVKNGQLIPNTPLPAEWRDGTEFQVRLNGSTETDENPNDEADWDCYVPPTLTSEQAAEWDHFFKQRKIDGVSEFWKQAEKIKAMFP